MEPISQALLGAAVAQAVAGRTLGPRAAGWGALVGMSPDLDVLLGGLHGGYGELLYHRGTTHSLWFGAVVGPLVGWLLWKWRGAGTPLRTWQWLVALALITHPLLDVFTPYGTQLFAPFSRARFAWQGVGIIDPFYTLPLGMGVFLAQRGVSAISTRARATLAITTLYLVAGVGLNAYAENRAQEHLRAAGRPAAAVRAYPTFLQPFLRRVVARDADQTFVGWYTTLRPGCIHGETFTERRGPAIDDLKKTWEGALFTWFAMDEISANVSPADGTAQWVTLDDLRYGGLGSEPSESMWGVRAGYSTDNVRITHVERFRRNIAARGTFDSLWSGTRGDFSSLAADPATRCQTESPTDSAYSTAPSTASRARDHG